MVDVYSVIRHEKIYFRDLKLNVCSLEGIRGVNMLSGDFIGLAFW